ncbi:MAG: phosphate acyltransferase [Acidiferrobacterales bacterium]|nr:phosphate acyltransferase [Acidiferrobacterales bacterium]
MSDLDRLTRLAQQRPRVAVLADATDERAIRAAAILAAQKIAVPVLTGEEQKVRSLASACNVALQGIEIADPLQNRHDAERYAVDCTRLRRPVSLSEGREMMKNPLLYGTMMLRCGDADALIAGASIPTARVIEAGLKMIGTPADVTTASSYIVLLVPATADSLPRTLIVADCAVNIDPTAVQLSEIVLATASNARKLLEDEPRIALLSFSSKGSARHEKVDKVTEAVELVRKQNPDVLVDGEFQFDSAINPRVAALKVDYASEVAGQANVLIFPDLNSGNIGYKIAQYLAGAQAIGPILQGFAKPISDLSRGATVDDIVKSTIVLLATT